MFKHLHRCDPDHASEMRDRFISTAEEYLFADTPTVRLARNAQAAYVALYKALVPCLASASLLFPSLEERDAFLRQTQAQAQAAQFKLIQQQFKESGAAPSMGSAYTRPSTEYGAAMGAGARTAVDTPHLYDISKTKRGAAGHSVARRRSDSFDDIFAETDPASNHGERYVRPVASRRRVSDESNTWHHDELAYDGREVAYDDYDDDNDDLDRTGERRASAHSDASVTRASKRTRGHASEYHDEDAHARENVAAVHAHWVQHGMEAARMPQSDAFHAHDSVGDDDDDDERPVSRASSWSARSGSSAAQADIAAMARAYGLVGVSSDGRRLTGAAAASAARKRERDGDREHEHEHVVRFGGHARMRPSLWS
jgi:hypothetical protein